MIRLCKMKSTYTENFQREEKFTNTMDGLLSYSQAFKEEYALCLVDMRIMNISVDMMSSDFLAGNSRMTYIRYIRADKLMLKLSGVLAYISKLRKNSMEANTLGFTHLVARSLYISSREDIFLIVQSADAFVQNTRNPPFFPRVSFMDETG